MKLREGTLLGWVSGKASWHWTLLEYEIISQEKWWKAPSLETFKTGLDKRLGHNLVLAGRQTEWPVMGFWFWFVVFFSISSFYDSIYGMTQEVHWSALQEKLKLFFLLIVEYESQIQMLSKILRLHFRFTAPQMQLQKLHLNTPRHFIPGSV